jgi:hypothetical protein
VFRSPLAAAVWYIWLVFAVLNLADLAWQGGGRAALVAAAVILLVTGVAYVAALRPRVIADDEAVTVRNPLRDIHLPWGAVTSIDLGDTLRLHYGPDRVVHCWAVQSSRRSRLRAQYRAQFREAQAARRTPGYGRMPEEARSRLTKSTGEIIALQITGLLEEARRRSATAEPSATVRAPTGVDAPSGVVGEASSGTVGRRSGTWCWQAVGALALPAVLLVLAVLVP